MIVAHTPERFGSVDEAMQYFNSTNRERFEKYLTAELGVKRDAYFRDQFKRLLETGERPKLGVDMWQLLGEVRCPILSMRGSRSDMYAAETMEKMKAANPRLGVVEVEAGHNIAGENPAGFVTALRPFLDALPPAEQGAFLADYRRRVAAAYPPESDGATLFPFRRLFIIALA